MLTRYHSTITLGFPRVRKRRKFMSSLIMANTPSDCMERLLRSRIPSSVEIFFSMASRCRMKYLDTFSRFTLSARGVLSVYFSFTGQSLQSAHSYTVTSWTYPVSDFRFFTLTACNFRPCAQVYSSFSAS